MARRLGRYSILRLKAMLAAGLLALLVVLPVSAQEGSCAVDADCPPGCVCWDAQCWLPGEVPTATPTVTRVNTPEPEPTTTSGDDLARSSTTSGVRLSGCLPVHAGAPVRLCETGSGSGWWLLYFGRGRSATGPHVAFPEVYAARGVETGVVLQTANPLTGAPLLVWFNAPNRVVVVLTFYGDGEKVYVFAIDERRTLLHLYW